LREKDVMVSDIMDVAKKNNYYPLLVDIDYSPSIDFSSMRKRRRSLRPFESYSTFSMYVECRRRLKTLLKIYSAYRSKILNSFNFKGIPLGKVFEKKFDFAVRHRFSESIFNILNWRRIIEVEKPISVLAIDELGLFGRSANAAAHIKDTPSVGMQHGMVGDNSYEYQCFPWEVGKDWKSPKSVLPSKLTTFGDITRNFLIGIGYDKNIVTKVGQPRYDSFYWMKNNFDKVKLKKKLGLPLDKKIIFLATQPIPGNEKITYEIMKSIKNIDDVFLVVKTHPREYDLDFYFEYSKKHNVNFKLFKDNLYELLFCSDLLITKNSTVALEAMIFDIPVITTNLVGLPDIFPFSKFNCTLQIDDPNLYKKSVSDLLFSKDEINKALNKQKSFLSKYLYKLDGKSSERIFNLLVS
jgi:hypothetical protein